MNDSIGAYALAETVYSAFSQSAIRWPDRPFYHVPLEAAKSYSSSPIDCTYAEADSRVVELVGVYKVAGVGLRHRVALAMENRVEFFLHYLALNSIGASIVPLNCEATSGEIAHILSDSRAILVHGLPKFRDLLLAATSQLEVRPIHAWLGEEAPQLSGISNASSAERSEAALLYTSGSTGRPKGCILANEYMLSMGRWYKSIGGVCAIEDGEERLLTPLPLFHMNALAASGMAMIMSGGCIVQLDRFHASTWWDTVRQCGATIVHYLGVMPAILLQAAPSPSDRKHNVKFGFGAGVHPKHHAAFEDRFGFPLVESWSMTEVGAGAAIIAQDPYRHVGTRCFGRPAPFMQYRIVDDNGQDVQPGIAGELWVRATGENPRAGFFIGYANEPELTEIAWAQGYFHTGDIVRMMEDESLQFVDRKKSIIRRSGENIASLEVEAVLNQLDQVRGVGVGPVDDEMRGEEVMACIELSPGHLPTSETAQVIFAAASERLSYFKVPGYIAFVVQLPLTPSQKLQRGALKELSKDLVESGHAFDLRELKRGFSGKARRESKSA